MVTPATELGSLLGPLKTAGTLEKISTTAPPREKLLKRILQVWLPPMITYKNLLGLAGYRVSPFSM